MANQAAGPIRLFVLGDARIETPKGRIEPTAELVFAAALYLILERHAAVSRRDLEQILWPDANKEAASHRLRQTLLRLRKLGFPVDDVGKSRLRVRDVAAVDADQMSDSTITDQSTPRALMSILPGYHPSFSPQFAEWVDGHRQRIGGALIQILLDSITDHRIRGRWNDVDSLASQVLVLEPYNEEATLARAETLAMRGSKLEAVKTLDAYLAEVGKASVDLKVPASVMRRRILDRMPSTQPEAAKHSIFVGREDPMRQLCSLLPGVRYGKGTSCLTSGDAGIGKSRLLTEFASFASLQGFTIVRVACRWGDESRPLAVFVDLVPMLRGLRGAIGCSPETMRYLDRITHHDDDHASANLPLGEAEFAYARVRQALCDVLDAVADETPLLVIIEDIHRLDESSRSLISYLIPWATDHRILFAFAARDEDSNWLEAVAESGSQVRLSPLDDQSAIDLVEATVHSRGRNIDREDIAWCIRVAEGNPYFLVELASHWMETGESHVAPPSLSAVINQRLTRLSVPTLQLLQTCALLENNCTIERLERVLAYEHHQLLSSINELGKLGMLTQECTDGLADIPGRLSPRHDLLALAAITHLSPPARAFLHRRIGAVMEEEIKDNQSAALIWDCAKHWQLAGDGARAFQLARSSANHLMSLGLCSLAADAFEKALLYCTSDAQRQEILEGQVAAYFRASDWAKLADGVQRLRSIQRYLHPTTNRHDDIELMEMRALWLQGDLATATKRARSCLECATASDVHRVKAGIMALMLNDLACDHSLMRRTYQSMSGLLDQPSLDPILRFESQMVFETVCGDLSIAMQAAKLFVANRRLGESVADLMRALTNGAMAARTAGELELSRAWLLEAIEIATSHKLPLASEIPMQALASIALDEADVAQAKQWYERLQALPTKTFDSTTIRNSIGLRIALCEGNITAARQLVQSDVQQLARDPNPHRRTYGLALLVAVELAERRIPRMEVVSELERAHLVSRCNARQAFATFVLVAALRRIGRHRRGDELLTEYLTTYRREPSPAPTHTIDLLESFAVSSLAS